MISFKFDARAIEDLPAPRPLYEIFVYSPRVEGIHLRFGKVARGGLRWSDRPQDFRTEILGLVKAQQVKNAVIVPVGAKGGFVPKRLPPPSNRDAWIAEGTEAYRIFVRSLLELTDNLDGDARSCRPTTPCAMTATIPISSSPPTRAPPPSPTSPTQSRPRSSHWLGDAFASGGSQGYDHKKMGITARGAWEAVKRHFREIGTDIQTDAVHRCRRRRHVGRRLRQRHAAVAGDEARRGLRSSRHLHRSLARSRDQPCRAPAPVRPAAIELAGLRQVADLARRRRVLAHAQGDPARHRKCGPCSISTRRRPRPSR